MGTATPASTASAAPKKQKVSSAAKANLLAKRKAMKQPAIAVPQPKRKSKMSPAAKARMSAKLKAYWANRKATEKVT